MVNIVIHKQVMRPLEAAHLRKEGVRYFFGGRVIKELDNVAVAEEVRSFDYGCSIDTFFLRGIKLPMIDSVFLVLKEGIEHIP